MILFRIISRIVLRDDRRLLYILYANLNYTMYIANAIVDSGCVGKVSVLIRGLDPGNQLIIGPKIRENTNW